MNSELRPSSNTALYKDNQAKEIPPTRFEKGAHHG